MKERPPCRKPMLETSISSQLHGDFKVCSHFFRASLQSMPRQMPACLANPEGHFCPWPEALYLCQIITNRYLFSSTNWLSLFAPSHSIIANKKTFFSFHQSLWHGLAGSFLLSDTRRNTKLTSFLCTQ